MQLTFRYILEHEFVTSQKSLLKIWTIYIIQIALVL